VRAASAGLGLAVLAGFSRVPELAQSQDLIQNVPLLLKVGAWVRKMDCSDMHGMHRSNDVQACCNINHKITTGRLHTRP